MDAALAILTVRGYRANQGGWATLVYLDGCPWQERELALGQAQGSELETELGLESGRELVAEVVAELADTGCLASKTGRAALEPELELEKELELEQGQ